MEKLELEKSEVKAMHEGHMYQIIGGHIIEVVREGDKLIPGEKPCEEHQ